VSQLAEVLEAVESRGYAEAQRHAEERFNGAYRLA
jgi:hypothetical protein